MDLSGVCVTEKSSDDSISASRQERGTWTQKGETQRERGSEIEGARQKTGGRRGQNTGTFPLNATTMSIRAAKWQTRTGEGVQGAR